MSVKKIVVFGGGTELSCLLSGLKLFPVDVTTVIAVSEDGSIRHDAMKTAFLIFSYLMGK